MDRWNLFTALSGSCFDIYFIENSRVHQIMSRKLFTNLIQILRVPKLSKDNTSIPILITMEISIKERKSRHYVFKCIFYIIMKT